MSKPELVTLFKPPLAGQIGPRTQWLQQGVCPGCGMALREDIAFLEYLFDFYNGEQMVSAMDHFAVTTKLRSKIESAGIVGVEFRPAVASLNDEIPDPMLADVELPELHYLAIRDRLAAGPGWADPGPVCPACGQRTWQMAKGGVQSMVGNDGGKGPFRSLSLQNYGGQDVFQMDDFARLVVSRRFLNLLEESGVGPLRVQPVILTP